MSCIPGSRALLLHVVTKKEAKRCDLDRVDQLMRLLAKHGKEARLTLAFSWSGWDHLPDEVYAIEPIRQWCAAVFKKYPHIFYFLAHLPHGAGMGNFVSCLTDVSAMKPLHLHKPLTECTIEDLMTEHAVSISMRTDMAWSIIDATTRYAESVGDTAENVGDLLAEVPGVAEALKKKLGGNL